MAIRSEAQKKAVAKYNSANYEQILVRVAKGEKERMAVHAEAQGESLNAFINRAIIYTMEHDKPDTEEAVGCGE